MKSSIYRGVSWYKPSKKWKASVYHELVTKGTTKHIGYFTDEIAAARAWDAFVVANIVDRPLNFPAQTRTRTPF